MKRALTNLKRIVAVLVVLCLMFSLIPASAFAAGASDISGHWAQVTIQSWMDKGLIKGYPDGTFKPDQNVTRAEFMTLANRAFGFTAKATINYTDVQADAWYTNAIAIAKAAGYISGYPDNTMKPENPITREEVATIVARIKNLTSAANAADKYTDAAKIGSWSKGQAGAVTSAKIMQGYPDGSFMPQGLMTRAEVVVASDNALHYTAPPVVTSNVAMNAIGDATVVVGGIATKTVTTTPADATVTAVSGTTAVAVVSITGHNITVTGVSAGTSKITVTGSKSGYGNGTAIWTVTVIPVPVVSGRSAPAPTTYTVTFDSQGGTPTPDPITGITSGATVTLPMAPTKTGYTFNGWFTAATDGTAFTAETVVTADITVHAQWTAVTYTVTFDSEGGNIVAAITGIASGAIGTLPTVPTKTGNIFASWNTAADGTGSTFDETTLVTADVIVYAKWTVITDVTSPAFTTTSSNNIVTITLTGGTFKTGIAAADFTFAGTDATALAAGTFIRTSDTVVTITGLTLAGGTNNTVTVPAATQATQASSVAAVAVAVTNQLAVDIEISGPAGTAVTGVTVYKTDGMVSVENLLTVIAGKVVGAAKTELDAQVPGIGGDPNYGYVGYTVNAPTNGVLTKVVAYSDGIIVAAGADVKDNAGSTDARGYVCYYQAIAQKDGTDWTRYYFADKTAKLVWYYADGSIKVTTWTVWPAF